MRASDDRFSYPVDPDAEPTDFDAALARFLLAHVRRLNVESVDSESQPNTEECE